MWAEDLHRGVEHREEDEAGWLPSLKPKLYGGLGRLVRGLGCDWLGCWADVAHRVSPLYLFFFSIFYSFSVFHFQFEFFFEFCFPI
jgi:hypothetical protein